MTSAEEVGMSTRNSAHENDKAWERFAFLASDTERRKPEGAERAVRVRVDHAPPMPEDLSIANRDAWVSLWESVVVNLGLGADEARVLASDAYDAFHDDPFDLAMTKVELYLRSRVRVTFENRANGVVDDVDPPVSTDPADTVSND